jgi:hypothetical protein
MSGTTFTFAGSAALAAVPTNNPRFFCAKVEIDIRVIRTNRENAMTK